MVARDRSFVPCARCGRGYPLRDMVVAHDGQIKYICVDCVEPVIPGDDELPPDEGPRYGS